MAIGTWDDDFTSKYGFGDGDQLESRDYAARKILVTMLNAQPEMLSAGIRALEYDRPGLHNRCMILLWKNTEGKSDAELLDECLKSEESMPQLPEMEAYIPEIVASAYEDVG